MTTALVFSLSAVLVGEEEWKIAVKSLRSRWETIRTWDVDSWLLSNVDGKLQRSGNHVRLRFDRGRFVRMDGDVSEKHDGKFASFDGKVGRYFAPAEGEIPERYSICRPGFAFLLGENPASLLGYFAFREVPTPLHAAFEEGKSRQAGWQSESGKRFLFAFLPNREGSKAGRKYILDPDREFAVAKIECYRSDGSLDPYLMEYRVEEWQTVVDATSKRRLELPRIVRVVGMSQRKNLFEGLELAFRSVNSAKLDKRFNFEIPASSYVDDFVNNRSYWASPEAKARFDSARKAKSRSQIPR